MAIKPTTTELRADTRITWASFGLPDPSPDPDTALAEEIDGAYAYVEEKTGRDLDTMVVNSNLGILAKRAVKLRTLQQVVQDQGAFISREIDQQIKSFAVPGYSETRFEEKTTGAANKYPASLFNDWPILDDLLRTLATPDKREEAFMMWLGDMPPASAITSVDWMGHRGRSVVNDPFFYNP